MDTRSKIVEWDCFVAAARDLPAIVSGYFDPLTDGHAEELEALAAKHGPLHVAIAEPPDPVLPAPARAELVAALRVVAAVAIQNGVIEHCNRISLEAADLERRGGLTAHVHSRHQPADKS